MARIEFYRGNMEPRPSREDADLMLVVMSDGRIAVTANCIYTVWTYRPDWEVVGGKTWYPSTVCETAEDIELALRDWVDKIHREIPGESGAEAFFHPEVI